MHYLNYWKINRGHDFREFEIEFRKEKHVFLSFNVVIWVKSFKISSSSSLWEMQSTNKNDFAAIRNIFRHVQCILEHLVICLSLYYFFPRIINSIRLMFGMLASINSYFNGKYRYTHIHRRNTVCIWIF